ncbi:MAG: type IV pilin protein [Gallionellaceae bacterium]|nr:type IV pilin protein [Gallionellaceae bacterium]MDD5365239.1 type IV pilin protein [Gallionellaceae bacterium]
MKSSRATLQKGFTLIELLIVVVIVGILAAIAIPSYLSYVAKAKRTEAKGALQEEAQFLEQYFTTNGAYTGASTRLTRLPRDGGTETYSITLTIPNASSFVLRAVPVNSMAADACGTFTLDQTGNQNVSGATLSVAECW